MQTQTAKHLKRTNRETLREIGSIFFNRLRECRSVANGPVRIASIEAEACIDDEAKRKQGDDGKERKILASAGLFDARFSY
jgi:hypothetical protein